MLTRLRSSLLTNLFDFDRETTAGEIIFFRIFEAFVTGWVLYLTWSWAFIIQRLGDIVLPLGIAIYLDMSFMFGNALPILNAVLVTGLAVAGFLRMGRWSYLVGFLFLHLQYAARYSQGEIPHSGNLVGMTFLGIGLAMAAFADPNMRRRFALGFTYFFMGFGYTIAAVCKLIGTGPSWMDGTHLWMWVNEKGVDAFSKTGVLEFNWVQQIALEHYWIATAFLMVGFVSELLAFLMWWKRFRMVVILAVIGLHFGIYMTMGIMFTANVYQLLLLCFPWAIWIDRVLARGARNPASARIERFAAEYA